MPVPLTLVAMPKAFAGHIGVIQRNALRSWAALPTKPRLVLLGDDAGVAEAAAEFGAKHVPDIQRTPKGTPRVDHIMAIAQREAGGGLACYINADIVLPASFSDAVEAVAAWQTPFLMVGRRRMLDWTEPVDFADAAQRERLWSEARAKGWWDIWSSLDYFVFPAGLYRDVPAFALGRGQWDNWLVGYARRQGVPVIDATNDVCAIHQNHDYAHAGGEEAALRGEESRMNVALAGRDNLFCVADATHTLRGGRVRPALAPYYLWRRVYTFNVFHPWATPLRRGLDGLLRVTRRARHRVGMRL